MIRRLKKVKKVRELVPDSVAEKAQSLNPLTKPESPQLATNTPRITSENITEHREEVLSGARKYIYPLQHSKHRIVVITFSLIGATLIAFLIYCGLALYRYYQYNTFLYRVTQVIPLPIAKTGGNFVDYENYLFELRHYVHYYQTQQQRDFTGQDKQQLLLFRKQALADVINYSYIKKLAAENKVSVSEKEINARIEQVRNQNRLGSSNKVFADVLRNYWGWSINDFKRSLKEQILTEKVVAKLDVAAMAKANAALAQLKSGADFSEIAKQVSDDPAAKSNNGDYGAPITKDNPNVPPQVVDALFKLKPGQISEVIETGPTLEIVKVNQLSDNAVTAQHISVRLQDISVFIEKLKTKQPPKAYVKF